jgi:hypothetical protein
MNLQSIIAQLATEKNNPCVTISLNTHRTHPENVQDGINLKNLLQQAETRVINEFGKRPAGALLERMAKVAAEVDHNHNLDSLHVFLSNDTQEVVRSPLPVKENGVQISESFSVRPLIDAYNRSEHYLILLLSQSGVQLYQALNDGILDEVRNADFPMSENRHYTTHADKGSDAKQVDDMIKEFLNKVDKAVVRAHQETGLRCVAICTNENFTRLKEVADKPSVYYGHVAIDYNHIAKHHIGKQAWGLVSDVLLQRRGAAISEMKEAVSQGKVLTDLHEIYSAALDGRADLLIVHEEFVQPVMMNGDRDFERITDVTLPGAIDDITSNIAWEVISKKGRVVFTQQDQIKDLGDIALKVRY